MEHRWLAIDLGASSGRHIVGWRDGETVCTEEVYRFPNAMKNEGGRLTWDIDRLVGETREGIDAALRRFGSLQSLSVDTWGVDYVLLREGGEVRPAFAYRDSRTEAVIEAVHALVPFSELYRRTGIQFQPFNTLYQLWADKAAGRLTDADDALMMPEYLLYKLCGVRAHEYTNATTTGLISAETGRVDGELLRTLGLPEHLFSNLLPPGTVIGEYRGIPCVLCASHDTASAVEGIPMAENMPYISSGTWSLLGLKTPKPLADERSRAGNWSNEGGVGYNRYQKNIMGLWLLSELRRELTPDLGFDELVSLAEQSDFPGLVDANDAAFLAPGSMKAAFDSALGGKTPAKPGDYFRCACRSLAECYARALAELERNTAQQFDAVTVVGGGAKNRFLNRLTGEASGKRVIALPLEATALGNLKIQMEALP